VSECNQSHERFMRCCLELAGFRYVGLRELHTVGLQAGFTHRPAALSYLADILEPTLDACQKHLEAHIARGDMRKTDARHAAIGLISPFLVVFLHQHALGGSKDYPLDIAKFAKDHTKSFVTAYRTGCVSMSATDEVAAAVIRELPWPVLQLQ
jgi:hypothetical protein